MKTKWCAIKLRIDCPECGSSVRVDGPWPEVSCEACGAQIPLAKKWPNIVEHALHHGKGGRDFRLVAAIETGPDGLGMRYMALNKGTPPICTECGELLDEVEDGVADGTEGHFHCPACGTALPTWPAPKYLRQVGARQVFLAPPNGEAPSPTEATEPPKPVVLHCPNCGAALQITAQTKRICTCQYCDVDTYLPATLWNQLHPVRKRRAFWLRFKG
jgi:predicted RNA-binding Zn-ribbon protein involved in translation (DUF1610 family)